MARTAGSRNQGYEKRRAELARAALPTLLAVGGARASLQELAAAAGASVPTVKHYFEDRAGFVAAALAGVEASAASNIEPLATPSSSDLKRSMTDVCAALVGAWTRWGVGRVFAGGLALALSDASAGPAYLSGVLEPTQQALERRLRIHALQGEADLQPGEERAAALDFIAPLLVALLHQHALSGARCRPLDLPSFYRIHVERFVRAWGPRGAAGSGQSAQPKPRRRHQ